MAIGTKLFDDKKMFEIGLFIFLSSNIFVRKFRGFASILICGNSRK